MLRSEEDLLSRVFAIAALAALTVVALGKDVVHDHDAGERSLARHEHVNDLTADAKHSNHAEQPDLVPVTVEQHEACPGCLAMVRRLGTPVANRGAGDLPPRSEPLGRYTGPLRSALSIDGPTGRAPPA